MKKRCLIILFSLVLIFALSLPLAALSESNREAGASALLSAYEGDMPAMDYISEYPKDYISYFSEDILGFELIALGISLVIGLCIALLVKSKMNNVHRSAGAGSYKSSAVRLTERADLFLYSTETRVRVETSSPGGGRGGPSRGGRGGHF